MAVEIKSQVKVTEEMISGVTGIHCFSKYLESTGILKIFESKFDKIKKSKKGYGLSSIFGQVICNLAMDKSGSISAYDRLKESPDYACLIEKDLDEIVSTSQVTRFFNKFCYGHFHKFREILEDLFITSLAKEKPKYVEIYIDTMVMDNDSALKREGVNPTYKNVKGFQPLQAIWNGYFVDAIFRQGSSHSNHGNDFIMMVKRLVGIIRNKYNCNIPIIIKTDSGFFSEDNFREMDELKVAFICSGKKYNKMLDIAASFTSDKWMQYSSNNTTWRFVEFEYGCDTWKGDKYRTIYTSPLKEGNQLLFIGTEKDSAIITNIGVNKFLEDIFGYELFEYWHNANNIIHHHHLQGYAELAHKRFKDFRNEHLPFKHFHCNLAFYYTALVAFDLFEAFKRDILNGLFEKDAYPSTVRNRFINCACKIIKSARKYIICVTKYTMKLMDLNSIMQKCRNAIPIRNC
jgi:hypothetical protein